MVLVRGDEVEQVVTSSLTSDDDSPHSFAALP